MFSELLASGYFPKELPPTFSTRTLGDCAARHPNSDTPLDGDSDAARSWRQYEIHNLARAGTLRRELAIVNPVSYWRLARTLASAWAALKTSAELSPISLLKPFEGLPRNLIKGRDLPAARASTRTKGKFILRTDISNFYASIYTHTVPWALHGKDVVKARLRNRTRRRRKDLDGERIDALLRAMQDGQSIGLPVGPDSSLIIAEVILSKIDSSILETCKGRGLRFIDDYELVFDSEGDAVATRSALESALAEYHLALNPLKTDIERLPQDLDDGWSRELWRMIAHKRLLTKTTLVDYFDRAFDLARSLPEAGVLKFALGKLSKKAFEPDATILAENLVLQCGRVEAGCLPHVLVILLRRETPRRKWPETLTAAFESIIKEHAPQRHSSEVAWSLWACLGFKLRLTKQAADLVMQMEDSVCALLLYQMRLADLLPGDVSFETWKTVLGADDLRGPRWLLTYELARLGYTLKANGKNYVTEDPLFGFLYDEKVAFFDPSRVGVVPPGLLPSEDEEEEQEEDEDDEDEYSEGGFWGEWDYWPDDDEDDLPAGPALAELMRELERDKAKQKPRPPGEAPPAAPLG